ncbi:MAG: hypothetical protein M0T78_12485 [Actinomycetota bacterium]|nr:hypothetical protein [Actinomycetota bacterium]
MAVVERSFEQVDLSSDNLRLGDKPYLSVEKLRSLFKGSLVVVFIVVLAYLHAKGALTNPNPGNDDEGTYISQAWALIAGTGAHHTIAAYTYWYDHPPFGWIQIGLWYWLVGGFHHGILGSFRYVREMTDIYFFIDLVLVYRIVGKLDFNYGSRLVTLLIFGLSPLAMSQLRIGFIDTLALPWLLAAVALILDRRLSLGKVSLAGLLFGFSVVTKETLILAIPLFIVALYQYATSGAEAKSRLRRFRIAAFLVGLSIPGVVYLLYAILRGELLPGPNHTSLIGAIEWQLFTRGGSGSILTANSAARGSLVNWISNDWPLLAFGSISGLLGLKSRNIRPISAVVVLGTITLAKPGYLPNMFVIAYLPFLAISIGGVISGVSRAAATGIERFAPQSGVRYLASLLALLIGFSYFTIDSSSREAKLQALTTSFKVSPQVLVEKWIISHIPKDSTMLVDDNYWLDLVQNGYQRSRIVWIYKLGRDIDVDRVYTKGWHQFQYIFLTSNTNAALATRPIPLSNFHTIAAFPTAGVTILEINPSAYVAN